MVHEEEEDANWNLRPDRIIWKLILTLNSLIWQLFGTNLN